MRTARAVLMLDLRVAWSYRFNFIVQSAGLLLSLLSFRFVADLVGQGAALPLGRYGGDYFSFVLLGLAVSQLSYPIVKVFAGAVRSAQTTGTFEAMLTTRANPAAIILGAGIYPIILTCVQVAMIVSVGALFLGARIELANLGLVLGVLTMTVVSLTGFGLMSAAFTIAFKQNEPFTGMLLAAALVLSGILYPTSVLPDWLQHFAPFLPMTHAIELSRGLLLHGATAQSLAAHAIALAGFCFLLPIVLVLLSAAIYRAKQTGSLSHY